MLRNQCFPMILHSNAKASAKKLEASDPAFEWQRSGCLGLALHSCAKCHGAGMMVVGRGRAAVCNCVLRSIFRIVLRRYMKCVTQEPHLSHVALDGRNRGRASRFGTYGRKDEEYIADVTLVSRRTLGALEWRVFVLHFLNGCDWNICTRKVGIDRGNFFHSVYRIEQKLGRVFAELQPYSLFPVDEYYNGPSRAEVTESELPRKAWVPERKAEEPAASTAPVALAQAAA